MYLSHLVQSLEQRQPFALQLFKEYRGQEWKSLVQYHHDIIRPKSVVLFKSDTKKLVLTGWNLMQYQGFAGKNAEIHTLVMEGNLYSRMLRPDTPLERKMLGSHQSMTSFPFTEWTLLCTRKCASLHLIEVYEDFHGDS